ncbi:MAG: Mrp/NBP35 family ATP-binding protein [Lentisphaerae bacterium]|nr:Mrp/NBP35 family ATP-binding protein [Lentisphaerota bacterium]
MSAQSSCSNGSSCSSCEHQKDSAECQLKATLSQIKHKIVVMSGKGGVGKSTVAVNLALALALEGKSVGLLDVDIHGPSIPKMLQLEGVTLYTSNGQLLPASLGALKVMSIGFMLQSADHAVIWRGPMKIGVIKQFLTEVCWGALDYLIIDSPPGTGDEPLSVCQLIPDAAGAIIVTTPQAVSEADVSKSVNFCQQLNFKILGLVENMSGFICPKCGELTEIFSSGAGASLSGKYNLPLLGKIPIDPVVCRGGDDGEPFIHHYANSASAKAFASVIQPILALDQA